MDSICDPFPPPFLPSLVSSTLIYITHHEEPEHLVVTRIPHPLGQHGQGEAGEEAGDQAW